MHSNLKPNKIENVQNQFWTFKIDYEESKLFSKHAVNYTHFEIILQVLVEDLDALFIIIPPHKHVQYACSAFHSPHHHQGPNPLLWEYGSTADCYRFDDEILKVGQELWRETMPLQGGSRFYQLQDLKPYTWYEVKISYPASIPASFSIQLKRDKSDVVLNNNRRLLNTEKLIFKTNSDQDKTHLVLVTVEPEGFPAEPHVPERQFIIFNIVCDELLLGLPYKAWWVVVLALFCLGIALIIPSFLPSYLLPKNQVPISADHDAKTS